MSEASVRFIVILLCTIAALIVSNDAHQRGMNGPLWGLLIFLFSIAALSVYLIVRKPLPGKPEVPIESPLSQSMKNANPAPKRIRLEH